MNIEDILQEMEFVIPFYMKKFEQTTPAAVREIFEGDQRRLVTEEVFSF